MSKDEKTQEEDTPKEDISGNVDMYPLRNRWDAVLFIAFIVAFLIFAIAILLYPQVV